MAYNDDPTAYNEFTLYYFQGKFWKKTDSLYIDDHADNYEGSYSYSYSRQYSVDHCLAWCEYKIPGGSCEYLDMRSPSKNCVVKSKSLVTTTGKVVYDDDFNRNPWEFYSPF